MSLAPAWVAQRRAAGEISPWAVAAALAGWYLFHLLVMAQIDAGLHVDEAQYWDWSRDLAWGYYSKPPVIAALIAASTALFGDGIVGLKALATLCYPLTGFVLYWLGREMAGERAGVIAAALFATSPLAGLLGFAATTDAPLLLSWSLCLWCLWRAWRAPTTLAWIALGLAWGSGLLSKYTAAAFLLTLAGFAWSQRHDIESRWRGLVLAVIVASACLVPNLVWNAAHGWPTLRHTAEITAQAPRLAFGAALASVAEFVVGQGLVIGPLVLAWAIVLLRRRRTNAAVSSAPPRGVWHLLLWSSLPLLAIGALQAWRAHAQINWAAPALIGAVLAVAVMATRAPSPWRWLSACVSLHVVLAVALAIGPDLARSAGRAPSRTLDIWSRMRGWDAAFESLRAPVQARPGAIVVATKRDLLAQGSYAWRDLPLHWRSWSADGAVHHHYDLLKSLPSVADPDAQFLLLSDAALPPRLQARFASVQAIARATVPIASDRQMSLQLWEARGLRSAKETVQ